MRMGESSGTKMLRMKDPDEEIRQANSGRKGKLNAVGMLQTVGECT